MAGRTGGRRAAAGLAASLLAAHLLATSPARAEEPAAEERARALYGTYLAERKDDSWGAFQRRLDALRGLGRLACDPAREALLRVASTGKSLDDRILAAQGLARCGDPPALEALLAAVAKRPHPATVEVVGEAIAGTRDGATLAWLGGPALGLSEETLGPVLRAHARLGLPEAGPALAARWKAWAQRPATFDLAFDAVTALGRAAVPEAAPPLREAAASPDVRLRLAAADGLPRLGAGDEGVVAAVRALLADPEAVVRRAAAAGIEAAKAESYVPDVAGLLGDDDPRTRKAAWDVLRRMTKRDFGFDAGAWRRWWEKRDAPDAPTPYTVPSYHGMEVFTERVVFVLDRSGSMLWPHAPGVVTRMDVARDALAKVLGEIAPSSRFNVFAFDAKVEAWRKGEAVAEERQVAKAVAWVRKQESVKGAGTNTYGVLEQAYAENPAIDTIYFLSDGIPEDGEITTAEGLLAMVRVWNRYRRVQIHAIALTLEGLHPGKYPITESMRRAAAFMRDLAAAGGGDFRLVARPP